MSEDFRKESEEHWKFVKELITPKVIINDVKMFDENLLKYLYVEAMIHGFKHGKKRKE